MVTDRNITILGTNNIWKMGPRSWFRKWRDYKFILFKIRWKLVHWTGLIIIRVQNILVNK